MPSLKFSEKKLYSRLLEFMFTYCLLKVCEKAYLKSLSQMFFFGGMLCGVWVAGILSDNFGRKTIIVPLILVMSLFGLASGLKLTQITFIWILCQVFPITYDEIPTYDNVCPLSNWLINFWQFNNNFSEVIKSPI